MVCPSAGERIISSPLLTHLATNYFSSPSLSCSKSLMPDSELPPIVYEDEALVAFDKPSGLLVAPDRWDHGKRNLAALAHERFGQECGNAHRLDRETSGVV